MNREAAERSATGERSLGQVAGGLQLGLDAVHRRDDLIARPGRALVVDAVAQARTMRLATGAVARSSRSRVGLGLVKSAPTTASGSGSV